MTYKDNPWLLEARHGHGSGGPRWIICAPDYVNRLAVISLNGAAHGDQNIALDIANLLGSAGDLLKACEGLLSLLQHETSGIETCDLPKEYTDAMDYAALTIAKAKGHSI